MQVPDNNRLLLPESRYAVSRNVVGFGWWGPAGAGLGARPRFRRRDRRRLRPIAMELEDRRLLSTFTVTSTADDGSTGTLRWEISRANATQGANTINFDPTVFATPQTITLTEGLLDLSNTTGTETITGPAAGVTVSGGGNSGVFQIDKGVTASISGLTITGGKNSGEGGGLYNLGTLTLTDCIVSDNSSADGGGLANLPDSTASLVRCTVSGNTAGAYGGGVYNSVGSTVDLSGCFLALNHAGYGGGLSNFAGKVTLSDCSIDDNSTYDTSGYGFGGGLANMAVGTTGGTMALNDCLVWANSVDFGAAPDFTTARIQA